MYSWTRRIVAGFLLLALFTSFWGIVLPHDAALWATRLQFVPALLGVLHGKEWAIVICISLILLTLLFGRVFCSWICPLGILQDISRRLGNWRGRYKGKDARPSKNHYLIRALFGVASFGSLALGSGFILTWLDPYSIAGRGVSALFHWNRYGLLLLGILLISLAIPLLMAFFKGRLYCNTICPVGALLGLLSRWAPFAPAIKKSACVRCAGCAQVCKAHAIDLKTLTIDQTQCINCYNCVDACPHDAMKLHKIKGDAPAKPQKKTKAKPTSTADPQRRALLGLGLVGGISTLLPSCTAQGGERECRPPVIPPGSKNMRLFLDRCTGCGLCISTCPSKVLRPSLTTLGWEGVMKPYLNTEDAACDFNCTRCGEVCPHGAIEHLPLAEKHRTQIGIAQILNAHCDVWMQHKVCGKCAEACPTKAISMNKVKIPACVESQCTHCELCYQACPEGAIHMEERNGNLFPIIDYNKCVGCGDCVLACRSDAMDYRPAEVPVLDKSICIGCAACVQACPAQPTRAITVAGVESQKQAALYVPPPVVEEPKAEKTAPSSTSWDDAGSFDW